MFMNFNKSVPQIGTDIIFVSGVCSHNTVVVRNTAIIILDKTYEHISSPGILKWSLLNTKLILRKLNMVREK